MHRSAPWSSARAGRRESCRSPALMLTPLATFLLLQSESLLPPPPQGWRTEHFTLPPDFAPDIEVHGVEDLLFAPGMFAPESDSYFSYVLALRFDGEVE